MLLSRILEAGGHDAVWDGRGLDGKIVPTGAYKIHLITAEEEDQIEIMVLRTLVESGPSQVGVNFGDFDPIFNPTRGRLVIPYTLSGPSHVEIDVFDRIGRRVRQLVNQHQDAAPLGGISWDGRNAFGEVVASNVYVIRLRANGKIVIKKVVAIK